MEVILFFFPSIIQRAELWKVVRVRWAGAGIKHWAPLLGKAVSVYADAHMETMSLMDPSAAPPGGRVRYCLGKRFPCLSPIISSCALREGPSSRRKIICLEL